MHELPITKSILKISVEEAEKHNAQRVEKITIKIGELTGLVPESIQYYFDIISKDTLAENAKLIVQKLPIKVRCKNCSNEYNASVNEFTCINCGDENITIMGGNEFYIESIEIEEKYGGEMDEQRN